MVSLWMPVRRMVSSACRTVSVRPEGDELRRHDAAGAAGRIRAAGRSPPCGAGGVAAWRIRVTRLAGSSSRKSAASSRCRASKSCCSSPSAKERASRAWVGPGEIGEHIRRQVLGQGAEHRRLPGAVLHGLQEGGDVHRAAALPKGVKGLAVPVLQKLQDLIPC